MSQGVNIAYIDQGQIQNLEESGGRKIIQWKNFYATVVSGVFWIWISSTYPFFSLLFVPVLFENNNQCFLTVDIFDACVL